LPLEDKEGCLDIRRSSFLAKHVFGDALKSRVSEVHVFGISPKTSNLAFCQK